MLPFRVDPEFFLFPYLTTKGLIPYHQIIDQHFPGGFFYLPLNFATLGLTTYESFAGLHLLIVGLIGLIIYKTTKKLLSPILFFSLWPFFDGFHLWIDTFLALFSLLTYFFYSGKKYLSAGIFIAISVFFKQTAVLLIPLLIAWEFFTCKKSFSFSTIAKITLPTLILFIFLLSYYDYRAFLYQTVIFNFTGYLGSSFQFTQLPKILIIFLPTLVLLWKKPLLFGFILINATSFFSRPDLTHLQSVAPFLILLLHYLLGYLPLRSVFIKSVYLSTIVIFFSLSVNKYILKPSGYRPYFDPDTLKVVEYLKPHVSDNQEIFLLGAQPHLYQLTNTLPAGHFFVYQLPWYMSKYQEIQLQILIKNPPAIIVYDKSAQVNSISISRYAEKLVAFTQSNYHSAVTFNNYVVYFKD